MTTVMPRPKLARAPVAVPVSTGLPRPYLDVVGRSALFRGLSPADVNALGADIDLIDVARATVVFDEGDPGDCLYVVLSGKVKITRQTGDGRQSLLALLGGGDEFGELSLLDPGPRTVMASVVSDARLARLSRAGLDEWIDQRPDLTRHLLRTVAHRLRRSQMDTADLLYVDAGGRLVRHLLSLARRFGVTEGGQIWIMHDLSQHELAQLVGSSRETVNKMLGHFAARGWLRIEEKCIIITDLERLTQRAR